MNFLTRFLILIFCFLGIVLYKHSRSTKKSGTVIILNGPSAAGKSSIQKEFQKLVMPNLWIKLGIDNLFDNPMPEITLENIAFFQSPNPIRWVEESKDSEGNKVITLFVGEQGEKVAYAMNSAIAAYAHQGCNVIVDYIAYRADWLHDLERKLKNIKTYYVAVEIPLEVLESREEARGTSPKGHARSHYFSVYGTRNYDLKVNTHTQSAYDSAVQLQNLVRQ